ncbi:MAG: hypothetical protein PHS95_03485, partial [Candidatus Pacebacteria bacterium]|nr:hypothetical protein [Candidatus Paceibacterota bacterium]
MDSLSNADLETAVNNARKDYEKARKSGDPAVRDFRKTWDRLAYQRAERCTTQQAARNAFFDAREGSKAKELAG